MAAATPAFASDRAALPPCPNTPKSVSTETPADPGTHFVAPLPLPDGLRRWFTQLAATWGVAWPGSR